MVIFYLSSQNFLLSYMPPQKFKVEVMISICSCSWPGAGKHFRGILLNDKNPVGENEWWQVQAEYFKDLLMFISDLITMKRFAHFWNLSFIFLDHWICVSRPYITSFILTLKSKGGGFIALKTLDKNLRQTTKNKAIKIVFLNRWVIFEFNTVLKSKNGCITWKSSLK